MGWRTTVFLVLLVLLAGGYLWHEPESKKLVLGVVSGNIEQAKPIVVVPLVPLDPNDIERIDIEVGGKRYEAHKRDGQWPGAIHGQAMHILSEEFGRIGRVSEIKNGGDDLEQYGLAQPLKTVWVYRRSQPTPVRIDFGRTNPALTGTYTRIDQAGPVILAGAALSWEVDNAVRALAQP